MWNLPCIYQWLNQPARVALLLLFLMLTCVIAIAIGRIVRFHTIRMHARLFQQAVSGALLRNEIRQALAIADTFDKTPVARLSPVGLTEFQTSIALLSKIEIIEWADRTLRRVRKNIEGQLKSGLGLMTTISYTAPLVGFFGTTLGIVGAFRGCGAEKWFCLAATLEGVSDALTPTAAGLLVAVPTVLLHRFLETRAKAINLEIESSSSELMNSFILRLKQTN
jgi:biopolymer transport protein ExbB/TolQ